MHLRSCILKQNEQLTMTIDILLFMLLWQYDKRTVFLIYIFSKYWLKEKLVWFIIVLYSTLTLPFSFTVFSHAFNRGRWRSNELLSVGYE